jgi:hypothetical protein
MSFERQRTGMLEHRPRHADVPEDEMRELRLVFADAREYAWRGRRSLGYALLLRALVHAERSLQQGQPWAPTLLNRTRELIDQYCEENDVAPGD